MGNHEGNTAPKFTAATGSNPRDNVVINGYNFITLSPRSSENVYGGSRYHLDEQWLKEQLNAATLEDPTKPVFIFIHHGIKDTAYGTDEWYTGDLKNILNDYPQVVHSYKYDFTNEKTGKVEKSYKIWFDGASAFMYPFSDQTYSKIKKNITLESVFKVEPFDSSYVDVFSNMESAGLGFEVSKISGDTENANLEFWVRVRPTSLGTGSYITISGNIKYNEYAHAMATYDGKTIKLYINGELENSKDVSIHSKGFKKQKRYSV